MPDLPHREAGEHLLLLSPSANRVYAGQVAELGAAELALTAAVDQVRPVRLAGIDYLGFTPDQGVDADRWLAQVATQSARLALFERLDEQALRPVELPQVDWLEDDLVTIAKYPGKTNEQFTRLLVNLTLAQVRRRHDQPGDEPLSVLDPLSGRGTTLSTAWLTGNHGFGVERDESAVEHQAAFLKTYLRRKRLKHTAELHPVRRDGRMVGRRLDAELRLPGRPGLTMSVMTGDTRDSALLWGRKRFDAVVADAPYGVVHGSHGASGSGTADGRTRSAAQLLTEAIPVWAGQLRGGGAMGISWNVLNMPREALAEVMTASGLEPCTGGAWDQLGHRVDSAIHRDVLVANKPTAS